MLVRPRSAEHEVRVAVDEARSHPGAAQRNDVLGAKARKLGPLANADDLPVGDADRAVLKAPGYVCADGVCMTKEGAVLGTDPRRPRNLKHRC